MCSALCWLYCSSEATHVYLCMCICASVGLFARCWLQLGTVDVLLLTVDDGCHLLTFEDVDRLIGTLSPRCNLDSL